MKLKLRSSVSFLASIFNGTGTAVRKDGLATYVDLDYDSLEAITSFDASTKQIAVHDSNTGEWNKTTLSDLLALAGYAATSLSPATIGLGSVSFTTQAGLAYRAGARARASNVADTSKYMEGLVTSYTGTTLTINISKVNGSGTFSNWNISLAGDPGTGDLLSTNNGLDFANLPTTLNNLTGVSFANTQSLTGAQKLKARTNIGLISGYASLNILDYGGVGDGATDNYAAFNAAYAALGTFGGRIYFPAGKYVFSSQIAKTYPSTRFSVTLEGDGSTNTTLYWSAGGGMQFTQNSLLASIHIRSLSVTTGATNTGTGIELLSATGQINNPWSDFYDVLVQGDDLNGSSTKYWAIAIHVKVWSCINFTNATTNGLMGGAPGTAGGGIGVKYEGNAGITTYGVLYNFQSCSFNGHDKGMVYGDYVQGVTVNQCNFNGAVGNFAINGPTATGVQSQLAISNCQLNYAGIQIQIENMNNLSMTNNVITAYGPAVVGIGLNLINSTGFQITGNRFDMFGVKVNTFGVAVNTGSSQGTISGNTFAGYDVGVNLVLGTSGVIMIGNAFPSTVTKYVNNGTSQTPGTASP